MNNFYKCTCIAALLLVNQTLQAAPALMTCSPEGLKLDSLYNFTDVLSKTKSVKIALKVSETNEYLSSEYFFHFFNLNSTDFLLLTTPELNLVPQIIGVGYSMYFGINANSKALDFYVFRIGAGFDSRLLVSFKEDYSDEQCVFKSEPNSDNSYAILKILSPTSFSIEWFNIEKNDKIEEYPTLTFTH